MARSILRVVPPQAIRAFGLERAPGRRAREVLRRPRHAPRGDDRLLRAALVRAAALPLALACSALANQADQNSFFVRELQRTFPSTSVDSILHAVRAIQKNATALGLVGARVPALVVALALQRARERVQHRLRPAEPRLPARQGAGVDDDGRLARRALRRARRRLGRRGAAAAARERRRQRGLRDDRLGRACRCVGIFVFLATAYYVLTNATLDVARGAAGRGRGGGAARGDVPGAAGVRASCRTTTRCCGRSRGRRVLLVWLYVMANVIVLGAEVNWHLRSGRAAPRAGPGLEPASAGRRDGPRRLRRSSAAGERLAPPAAVRVLALPAVAELGDRPVVAVRDEDRVVAEAARPAALASRSRPRARRCRGAPRRPARPRRATATIRARRFGSPPSRSSSASAWSPLGAQRAECRPGSPPSASHSMPESSPSTHSPGSARPRPNRALSRAFSS